MVNKNHSFNGVSPSINGHEPANNGHEVSYDPAQIALPWVEQLLAATPTVTKESPEAASSANSFVQDVTNAKAGAAELRPVKRKQARYRETGHAVNVENLSVLHQIVIGFGPAYIQGNPLFTVANMEAQYTTAKADLLLVKSKKSVNELAIDQQKIAFSKLKDMSTRSKNIFLVSGVSDEAMKRCEYLNHQIQGSRVIKIKKGDDKDHVSASHQSHTQQIQHVDGLVELFDKHPQYAPPVNLDTAAWTAKRDAMYTTQQALNVTEADLSMTRLSRNINIYKPTTGLVDIGNGVKKMVLGIFGFKSPQYAMVKGIQFYKMPGYKNL